MSVDKLAFESLRGMLTEQRRERIDQIGRAHV